jgi:diguanylate cyclase (GGDEF)-like protein/PAS domain S-box-containing protein
MDQPSTENNRMDSFQVDPPFRDIVETADFGVGVIDREGTYIFANRKWAEMTGYSLEEIQRCSVAEITFLEDLSESREKARALFAGTIPAYILEKRIRRKDGSWFWGRIVATPIRGEGGEVRAINGLIADITTLRNALERIRLDAALQKLIARLTALPLSQDPSPFLLKSFSELLVADSPFLCCALYKDPAHPVIFTSGTAEDPSPATGMAESLVEATLHEGRPVAQAPDPEGLPASLAGAGLPVIRSGHLWGVLLLFSRDPALFDEDRLPRLEVISRTLSMALESESLSSINTALHRISRLIGSRPVPRVLFDETCRILVDCGGLQDASIILHDPESNALVPEVIRGRMETIGRIPRMQFSLSPGHPDSQTGMARAFLSGKPVITQDFSKRFQRPGFERIARWARRFSWRSGASFPLVSRMTDSPDSPVPPKGRVIGLLTVTSGETGFFHDRLVGLLEEAANGVALALDMHREDLSHGRSREKLSQMTELYAALNGINRLVNQRPDEKTLFEETCRIINEIGMLYLVRILAVDRENGLLKPVAVHARNETMVSFFRALSYRTDPETQEKLRHLSPQACLSKNRPVIHHNLVKELETMGQGALSAKAMEFGLWSQGSFPLYRKGQASYILSGFAERVGFFDGALVSLLEEISRTVSFALDNIDRDREKQQAEETLRESEEKYRLLMEEAGDGIVIVDLPTQTVVDANRQACLIFGQKKQDLLGLKMNTLLPESARTHLLGDLSSPSLFPAPFPDRGGHHSPVRYHLQDSRESYREVEVVESRIDWRSRPLLQVRLRDVTELHFYESELKRLARQDSLTGLLNRHALWSDLEHRLSNPSARRRFALFYIDLDHFKTINDSYGHETGDLLLKSAGRRIRDAVRESDLVARIGGDEFLVLASESVSTRRVRGIARRILAALESPFQIHGHTFTIHASVGISFFPDHASNPEELIKKADAAMYQSKRSGRNRFTLHEATSGLDGPIHPKA